MVHAKCLRLIVNELIEEGHKIEILDVDQNLELAQQYSVSVPMIVIEEDGKIVDGVLGATSKKDLIQRLS